MGSQLKELVTFLRSDLRVSFEHREQSDDLNELWKTLMDFYWLEASYPSDQSNPDDRDNSDRVHNIHQYFQKNFEAELLTAELSLLRAIEDALPAKDPEL